MSWYRYSYKLYIRVQEIGTYLLLLINAEWLLVLRESAAGKGMHKQWKAQLLSVQQFPVTFYQKQCYPALERFLHQYHR